MKLRSVWPRASNIHPMAPQKDMTPRTQMASCKVVPPQLCLLVYNPNPIGSMYGIFTYIWVIFGVNVGRYSIHGSYGNNYRYNPHSSTLVSYSTYLHQLNAIPTWGTTLWDISYSLVNQYQFFIESWLLMPEDRAIRADIWTILNPTLAGKAGDHLDHREVLFRLIAICLICN